MVDFRRLGHICAYGTSDIAGTSGTTGTIGTYSTAGTYGMVVHVIWYIQYSQGTLNIPCGTAGTYMAATAGSYIWPGTVD